jgi:inner membrane protein
MASVSHVFVGLAAARVRARRRPPWRAGAFWAGVALLPDLDFLMALFGYRYGELWGHRGVSHSFAFAALCGLIAAIAALPRHSRWLGLGTAVALVCATHPLLDAMTNYGIGCPLFWPLSDTRWLLPWRIVPTIPRFDALYTIEAWKIAAQEALRFSPLLAFALWPTSRSSSIGNSKAP